MQRHQGAKDKHFDVSNVSNVIYDKFSHGAVSYKLNGKIVNVMLEFSISRALISPISRNIVLNNLLFNLHFNS